MDSTQLKQRIDNITKQREALVKLLDKPNLGTLSIDVTQTIEELDILIDEFNLTFSLN